MGKSRLPERRRAEQEKERYRSIRARLAGQYFHGYPARSRMLDLFRAFPANEPITHAERDALTVLARGIASRIPIRGEEMNTYRTLGIKMRQVLPMMAPIVVREAYEETFPSPSPHPQRTKEAGS